MTREDYAEILGAKLGSNAWADRFNIKGGITEYNWAMKYVVGTLESHFGGHATKAEKMRALRSYWKVLTNIPQCPHIPSETDLFQSQANVMIRNGYITGELRHPLPQG